MRDPFFSADRVADLRRELRGMLGEIRARKLKTYDDVMDMIASERDVQLMYPASTNLVHMVATFPVGTATCERCFSKMKLLKTRLRKRLYDSTMENILHLAFSASYSPSSGVREETMRSIFCCVDLLSMTTPARSVQRVPDDAAAGPSAPTVSVRRARAHGARCSGHDQSRAPPECTVTYPVRCTTVHCIPPVE